MCISILSTAHPDYPFILISNRDEVISRPTLRADWWDSPYSHVLAGRDLQREERGTWLGITKQGRFAVLTNFREEGAEVAHDKSRGGIVNTYLKVSPSDDETEDDYVRRLLEDVGIHDVGGFTLLFGKLRAPSSPLPQEQQQQEMPGLAMVSNRTRSAEGLQRIATHTGETHGLSNSHFGDMTWPKVVHGEQLLKQAIHGNFVRRDGQARLIERLFEILSLDTLPQRKHSEGWDVYARNMRNSIAIPPAKGEIVEHAKHPEHQDALASAHSPESALGEPHAKVHQLGEGAYGTSKQTVILVDREGRVTFIERTLYDEQGWPVPEEERDRAFGFEIEGWNGESRTPTSRPGLLARL